MNITDLLLEAAILMLTGMIVVFTFLTILIFTIKAMSRLLINFQDPVVQPTPAKFQNNKVSTAHVAAIAAAVKQYREKQQ